MINLFPTSRSVRSFYTSQSDNSLLPFALPVAEFHSKALFVKGKVLADEDSRILLMQEAADFRHFSNLHIPKEFMAFLRNSEYLFRFFEELSAEEKEISDLENADVYAEFSEHLEILKTLFTRYEELLEKHSLYDHITLPKVYELNEAYLKEIGGVKLHLEGYLSSFELRIFSQISKIIPVHISIFFDEYNQKMLETFSSLGYELPKEGEVVFDLNTKEIISHQKSLHVKSQKEAKGFSSRSLQIGYIFHKIQEMIDDGMSPEDIVVVLPDESMVELLRRFDKLHNFNFAMGKSFKQSILYKFLRAMESYVKDRTPSSKERLKRFGIEDTTMWQDTWTKTVEFATFEELVSLHVESSKEEERLYKEELYKIKQLTQKRGGFKFFQLLQLFLRRLAKLSLDDVSGGKITVMGVLETRGVSFKGVIIPDFNDDLVPKRSHKDLFLSSKLRHHASLPDAKDRENLQRYFYSRLLKRAQRVVITYVANEEKLPARFLKHLHVKMDESASDKEFVNYLMRKEEPKKSFTCKELVCEHDFFSFDLSASRLKSFLTCPRQYYFRYVKDFKDAQIPDSGISPIDVGNMLHEALEDLYKDGEIGESVEALHERLHYHLKNHCQKDPSWQLESDVWSYRLKTFCENEIKRAKDGWQPLYREKKEKVVFEDILLSGKIDRIDRRDDGSLAVLDYKSGSFPKTTPKTLENAVDFQMQFYFLLASNLGSVEEVGYYDLKDGLIVYESMMSEKLERLKKIITELKGTKEVDFHMCEKLTPCTFCPYVKLCERG